MQDYKALVEQYNDTRYFLSDPLAVVRRAEGKCDREILGIVCSWLAYGNRNQIYKTCVRVYEEVMECRPHAYLMSERWRGYEDDARPLYRLYRYRDFASLMRRLFDVYCSHDSLQSAVQGVIDAGGGGYLDALIALLPCNGIPQDRKSACKRLCLFLRWMVRDDGVVDLGVWSGFDKRRLLVPLDTHVRRIAAEHGLLSRRQADMRAVEELTARCREIFPDDPAVMDFALFGLGYTEKNEI